MTERTYVYTIHIATTPEALWRALTSSEFTEQYWGGSALESGKPLEFPPPFAPKRPINA